jgi:ribosomal protein RSM22 (predicted rRNA methylase)
MLTAALPPALERAIDALGRPSARASGELSARYRDEAVVLGPVARTREDVAAYAAARLPATYAAMRVALGELAERCPSLAPERQLDLGAGPGTALWAAADVWPTLRASTAVEAEPAMAELGRALAAASDRPSVAGAAWIAGRLPEAIPDERFDLVTLGYVLAELDDAAQAATVERAWDAAGTLVVVEPGTPAGYRRVLAARDRLLGRDAVLAAPCPHERACPLAGGDHWCHFAVRLPRSSAHRQVKGAELGHEDEKLSYVAVTREPAARTEARVLRHPQVRPGHVLLELCTDEGVVRETVSKRDRERYRRARKASWGEGLG